MQFRGDLQRADAWNILEPLLRFFVFSLWRGFFLSGTWGFWVVSGWAFSWAEFALTAGVSAWWLFWWGWGFGGKTRFVGRTCVCFLFGFVFCCEVLCSSFLFVCFFFRGKYLGFDLMVFWGLVGVILLFPLL